MVTRLFVLAVTLLFYQSCTAPASAPDPTKDAVPYPGMTLIWADEFDAPSLDTADWNYLYGTGYNNDGSGWGNNELQYYRAENTTLAGGLLTIIAREENFENRAYTSSRLTTDDKHEVTFGRIDTRAKLPIGQGIWPAIWMLGAEFPGGKGWPAEGEIDIMEYLGHQPNTIYGTAHYGSDWRSGHRYQTDTLQVSGDRPFHSDFHVYSIDWRHDTIDWLVDGEQFGRFTATDAAENGQAYPFNAPQYLLLNLAVGGNWPGNPDSTTVFPQEFIVDYVRIYQRADSK